MAAQTNNFTTNGKASEAGKKSKRKPLDITLAEYFENYIQDSIKISGEDKPRMQLMFDAAYKAFLKGNSKPLAYLVDRGFGKAKGHLELSGQVDIPAAQIHIDGKPIADSDN